MKKYYNIFLLTFIVCCILFLSCKKEKSETPKALEESELIEIAQAIHEKILIFDAHADIATPTISPTFLSADGLSKVDFSKLKKGGYNSVVMTLAVPPGPRTAIADAQAREEINSQLESVQNLVAEHPEEMAIVTSVSEMHAAQNERKTSLLLGFQNARALENDISAIDSLYQSGVRMFALTHLGHNSFADSSRPFYNSEEGSYEPTEEHGGLSALGKSAIVRMNELGAIIDVSQLSKPATIQAIELSKVPVMASHSNVRRISDVSRNLSNEEIDLIGKNDGVIHISAFRAYLLDYSNQDLINEIKAARRAAGVDEAYSYPFELYWEIDDPKKKMDFLMSISDIIGPADVDHLIDHIEYIVKRIGIDHVGIGTDFNHGSGIDGFADASEAFNVTLGLVKRGYSAEEIEKIWGANFLRVFKKVEQGKTL